MSLLDALTFEYVFHFVMEKQASHSASRKVQFHFVLNLQQFFFFYHFIQRGLGMACRRENEILLFHDNKSQLDLGEMGSGFIGLHNRAQKRF